MRTVVLQSFRTTGVPDAIARCLASVEDWARLRGYAYRFVDDSLFDEVPAWFRDKVAGDLLPMSDLARLLRLQRLIDDGCDRVIWLDADVLVFDPDRFIIDVLSEYAVGREVWVRRGGRDRLLVTEGLHNAAMVFCRANSFLDIGYPLRSPIRSRSVLKTHKKTPMYGLISTHSYRIGNKGKFHNHES